MLSDFVRIVSVAALAVGLLAGAPGGVLAQEEEGGEGGSASCELQGTDITSQAEDLINSAAEQDSVNPAAAKAQYDQALKRVQLAMQQDSTDATAYWLGGRVHLGLDNYARADSLLNRFVQLKPACAKLTSDLRFQAWAAAYNRGIRSYQAGDDSAALVQFEKASTIHDDSRALNNAALLHQQRGNLERAEELYRRSMEVAADSAQLQAASINLAELLRSRGRTDESLTIYRDYLEQRPDDVTALINYAVGLRTAGQNDSAQAVLDRVMSRDDLAFEEWYNVGLTLMQMQSFDAAGRAFQRAREMQPYDKATMQHLASVSLGTGDVARAAAIGDTLVNWYPYERQLYKQLMQALDKQGRTGEVQKLLPALQSMPLEIVQMSLVRQSENQYVLQGQVASGTAAGQTVTLPVEFFDSSGQTVTTREIQIQVPAQGQAAQFQVPVETDQPIAGFRYDGIQGSS